MPAAAFSTDACVPRGQEPQFRCSSGAANVNRCVFKSSICIPQKAVPMRQRGHGEGCLGFDLIGGEKASDAFFYAQKKHRAGSVASGGTWLDCGTLRPPKATGLLQRSTDDANGNRCGFKSSICIPQKPSRRDSEDMGKDVWALI
eukprot:Skav221171  [mRNA]  locus=scaffold85:533718:534152:+ [translate_table: standard]